MLLKSLGVVREILFVSVWENLESLIKYAGINWNKPVSHGNETELLEVVPEVKHYHEVTGSLEIFLRR